MSIEHADVKYNSIYGQVESSWKREIGKTVYFFTIPANCTATVILPGGQSREYPAGSYTIEQ